MKITFFVGTFPSVKRILKSPESDLLKVQGLPRFDCLVIPYYNDSTVIPHGIFQRSCQFCVTLSDKLCFLPGGCCCLCPVSSRTARADRKILLKSMNGELQRICSLCYCTYDTSTDLSSELWTCFVHSTTLAINSASLPQSKCH